MRCSYIARYESAHTAYCFAKWRRFYGGQAIQPASMASKTEGSCLLPTWPAGAARKCLRSVGAQCRTAGSQSLQGHPAIVNSEARFHPVGAGTNFTVAERQRAGMRTIFCLLPAPNSIFIFLDGSPRGPGPKPRRTLGTFLLWKVPRRRLDKPSPFTKLSYKKERL